MRSMERSERPSCDHPADGRDQHLEVLRDHCPDKRAVMPSGNASEPRIDQLIGGVRHPQTIHVAVKLSIPDLLAWWWNSFGQLLHSAGRAHLAERPRAKRAMARKASGRQVLNQVSIATPIATQNGFSDMTRAQAP